MLAPSGRGGLRFVLRALRVPLGVRAPLGGRVVTGGRVFPGVGTVFPRRVDQARQPVVAAGVPVVGAGADPGAGSAVGLAAAGREALDRPPPAYLMPDRADGRSGWSGARPGTAGAGMAGDAAVGGAGSSAGLRIGGLRCVARRAGRLR